MVLDDTFHSDRGSLGNGITNIRQPFLKTVLLSTLENVLEFPNISSLC